MYTYLSNENLKVIILISFYKFLFKTWIRLKYIIYSYNIVIGFIIPIIY